MNWFLGKKMWGGGRGGDLYLQKWVSKPTNLQFRACQENVDIYQGADFISKINDALGIRRDVGQHFNLL